MISALKMELKDLHFDFEALTKSVRMLSFGTQVLDSILKVGKIGIDKKGPWFFDKDEQRFIQGCSNIVFVWATKDQDKKRVHTSPEVNVIKQKVFKKNIRDGYATSVVDLATFALFVFSCTGMLLILIESRTKHIERLIQRYM